MPASPRSSARRLFRLVVATGLLTVIVGAGWAGARGWGLFQKRPAWERLRWAAVQRKDLHATVTVGGRVESAKRTVVECELENLSFSTQGRALNAAGASTIIELVPEGATVKKGDVLCRLDSSDFEELVRQQEIKVQEAHAGKERADLERKAAEMAVTELREGTWGQTLDEYKGRITLAEVELRRQRDRVTWSKEMGRIGYLSSGTLAGEEQSLKRAEINLKLVNGTYRQLIRYGGMMTLQGLLLRLDAARRDLDFQAVRVDRMESRLARFRRQVERCTIRAPHDGFLVYANDVRHNGMPLVELGAPVWQKMRMFYLPDLARMEVEAVLHESVVDRVRRGMPARVWVEGLPHYSIEGDVVAVADVPMQVLGGQLSGKEVINYLGRVRLHSAPKGLLPGMTAQVEIVTARRPGALVVPTAAVAVEEGREVCYVARGENLERRPVKLGEATRDLLEVTDGLQEGEEVVLDPSVIQDEHLPVLADATPAPGDDNVPDSEAPVAH